MDVNSHESCVIGDRCWRNVRPGCCRTDAHMYFPYGAQAMATAPTKIFQKFVARSFSL